MLNKISSLAILGSTGSIGDTSLEVLNKYSNKFKLVLLVCKKNKKKIIYQIKKFKPSHVIIEDNESYNYVKKINFNYNVSIFNSLDNFSINNNIKLDKVVLGISSINGLKYAFKFIEFSKKLLIANKETIVCGGKLLLNKAKKFGCNIESIDSEHFCIHQLLKNVKRKLIKKVYLTASGGPFLNKKKKSYAKVKVSEALNHPKWKMGKKISIDSATMANKALELIEASILFNLKTKDLEVKIHPESNVHAVLVLKNGLIKFIAHNTSMKIPILNSLLSNNNFEIKNNFFLKKNPISFTFDEICREKFKVINIAYKVINEGHRYCIFFNVINDYLVNLYLNKKIFFYEIEDILIKTIYDKKYKKYLKKKVYRIKDIYETINYAENISKKLFFN